MNETIGKINPMFSEDDFVRKAWITLAREDAPIEVFKSDFSDVSRREYQVYSRTASHSLKWQAQIGHDRQESYTDFETYYVDVPYTAYENRYNSSTKTTDRVPVTKTRREERQRQVSKTRRVTDWHSGNGEHSVYTKSFACLDAPSDFRRSAYASAYKEEYVSPLSSDDPEMKIESTMDKSVWEYEYAQIQRDLERAMPGDHARDIQYSKTDLIVLDAELIKVPEYSTTIKHGGKTYTKRSFAFGDIKVEGEQVKNSHNLMDAVAKEERERDKKVLDRNRQIEGRVWRAAGPVGIAAIALLLLSIVLSLFVKMLVPTIVAFVCAVGAYIFSKWFTKSKQEKEKRLADEDNCVVYEYYADIIANYTKNHRSKVLKALNAKLASLGFEPAREDEYSALEEEPEEDEADEEDEEDDLDLDELLEDEEDDSYLDDESEDE